MFFVCFLFALVLIIVGCNKNNDKEMNKIDSNGNKELTDKANPQEQNDNENENNEENMNKNFTIVVDHKLTGIELIKAAKITNPIQAIAYDMKTVIGGSEVVYETIGSMIKSGKSFKSRTDSQGEGVEVTIYNSDEQMTYKYFEARKEGYKYKDDMTGNGPAMEGEYDLTMLYAEESNLSKAEVIDYEGEPVIYFEIIEGNNKILSWISLRYGIAIKTEMYDGKTLVSQTTIKNISLPASVAPSTFMPPNDVIFQDYSIAPEDDIPLEEGDEGVEDIEDSESIEDILIENTNASPVTIE